MVSIFPATTSNDIGKKRTFPSAIVTPVQTFASFKINMHQISINLQSLMTPTYTFVTIVMEVTTDKLLICTLS